VILAGDLMHHPAQFAYPQWAEIGDYDVPLARETRRAFIAEHSAHGTLLAVAHFSGQPVGRAHAHGRAWRFVPEAA
jgi:hypothetical protein